MLNSQKTLYILPSGASYWSSNASAAEKILGYKTFFLNVPHHICIYQYIYVYVLGCNHVFIKSVLLVGVLMEKCL